MKRVQFVSIFVSKQKKYFAIFVAKTEATDAGPMFGPTDFTEDVRDEFGTVSVRTDEPRGKIEGFVVPWDGLTGVPFVEVEVHEGLRFVPKHGNDVIVGPILRSFEVRLRHVEKRRCWYLEGVPNSPFVLQNRTAWGSSTPELFEGKADFRVFPRQIRRPSGDLASLPRCLELD